MEPVLPPNIINKEKEYEVEEIRKHQKKMKNAVLSTLEGLWG